MKRSCGNRTQDRVPDILNHRDFWRSETVFLDHDVTPELSFRKSLLKMFRFISSTLVLTLFVPWVRFHHAHPISLLYYQHNLYPRLAAVILQDCRISKETRGIDGQHD